MKTIITDGENLVIRSCSLIQAKCAHQGFIFLHRWDVYCIHTKLSCLVQKFNPHHLECGVGREWGGWKSLFCPFHPAHIEHFTSQPTLVPLGSNVVPLSFTLVQFGNTRFHFYSILVPLLFHSYSTSFHIRLFHLFPHKISIWIRSCCSCVPLGFNLVLLLLNSGSTLLLTLLFPSGCLRGLSHTYVWHRHRRVSRNIIYIYIYIY